MFFAQWTEEPDPSVRLCSNPFKSRIRQNTGWACQDGPVSIGRKELLRVFFVGGLFVGLAIGEFVGNRQAGAMLGLGIAFVAQGLANSDWLRKRFNR